MYNTWMENRMETFERLAPDGGADGGSTGAAEGADNGGQTPTFDDALKTPGYQAEFDRRITKALETAKTKWQQDAEARVAAAKSEAEKLAGMTAEQKAAAAKS